MGRGPFIYWVLLAWSIFALLFPHTASLDFLEEASVVRWMAVPLLIVSAIVLADHYNVINIQV